MNKIRVSIVGVGNCASSLIQGIYYYGDQFAKGDKSGVGLAHSMLGGYAPGDIQIVGAIDIDARKVGRPLHEAMFAQPNNTKVFYDSFQTDGVVVQMGNVLDGVAEHMANYPERPAVRRGRTALPPPGRRSKSSCATPARKS